MRILVLNGVNLERARPARPEALRRLVARRARVADLPVGARRRLERAVQADEQRGRVHQLDPRGARLGRRRDREPGRVDALQLRDPRRARAVRGADRRGASLERRRARGVAAQLGDLRPRRAPHHRQRARWDTRRRSNGCRRTSERARRAAARRRSRSRCSSRPASTSATSSASRARTPRCSSTRSALLLFTDFRYAEAARAVDGVEFVQSQRSLFKTVGETLDGARRLRGERAHVRRLGDAARRRARARAARRGLVERLRAVKDEARARDDPRGGAHHRRASTRRSPRSGSSAAPSATSRGAWSSSSTSTARTAVAFEIIVGSGPTGALPHGRPTDRVVEANTTVVVDAGCVARRLQLGLHAHVRDRRSPDDLARGVRGLPARAARRPRGDARGHDGRGRRRGGARA